MSDVYKEYGLLDEETAWSREYELPPPINMMETHERREKVFVVQGTRMFKSVEQCIIKYCGSDIKHLNVLDFGCGVGRVCLPFYYKYGKPDRCFDVDGAVIDYLRRVIPGANPEKIGFEPPMPAESNQFDCLFAISVWTHLDPDTADAWMHDVIRVLKPGGVALISTANYAALEARRKFRKDWIWSSVTDDDLRKAGTMFHQHPPTAGVTGLYGNAAHDPEWLRREWSAKYMPVVEIVSGGILGVQDINVMIKPLSA